MVFIIFLDCGFCIVDSLVEVFDLLFESIILRAVVDLGVLKSLVKLGLEIKEPFAKSVFFRICDSADNVITEVFESGRQRVVGVIFDELVEIGKKSLVSCIQGVVVVLILFQFIELIFENLQFVESGLYSVIASGELGNIAF